MPDDSQAHDQHQPGSSKRSRRNAVQVVVVLGIGTIATWASSEWFVKSFGTAFTVMLLCTWALLFFLAVWRITR